MPATSIADGHQALIRRIVTMTTSANIVLPNGPGADLPRYHVQEAGGMQRTFARGTTEARPEVVVRVETQAGAFATLNNQLVSELVSRFPVGETFDGVTIVVAPLPRPPLPVADGVYSVPVVIRGFMSF